MSEIRLQDKVTSGKFDLYGKILDNDDGVLGDLKVTSSYKLAKALGIYKIDVSTGEVFKTGTKKGQAKTRKEFRYDGVRHVMDWTLQLNYYRMLLEASGFAVKRMVIQAMCRDHSLRTAAERGIDRPVYIIPINKISDRWLVRYFSAKAQKLKTALDRHKLPSVCSYRERWGNRKCLEFCEVRGICPYSQQVQMAMFGMAV